MPNLVNGWCAHFLRMTQSTMPLMKAKFSLFDQVKFNEPVLKPGTPE